MEERKNCFKPRVGGSLEVMMPLETRGTGFVSGRDPLTGVIAGTPVSSHYTCAMTLVSSQVHPYFSLAPKFFVCHESSVAWELGRYLRMETGSKLHLHSLRGLIVGSSRGIRP